MKVNHSAKLGSSTLREEQIRLNLRPKPSELRLEEIDSEHSRTVNVLGVKIDDVSIKQIVKIVEGWILASQGSTLRAQKHYVLPEAKGKVLAKRGFYIVTPNPEIVVIAQKDPELKKIINQANLSIPDGNGLKILTDIVCNSPGIDVMEELVKLSAEKGYTIGLLGGRDGVAEKCAECLQKKYKNLKVTFVGSGGEVDEEGDVIPAEAGIQLANRLDMKLFRLMDSRLRGNDKQKIDILFVAFGPPKQEKWIAKNLEKFPVKVMMTVGGSFDYISGRVPRAPLLIRKIGFEWLFRLFVQPWRIKRQMALLEYIWLLTKERLGVVSSYK